MDRAAFRLLSRGIVPPPASVSGAGSTTSPWIAQSTVAALTSDAIVSLEDDREGLFQSNPPAPLDFAVLLRNFPRLGSRKAAIATPLAWDAPDPLGLSALEKTLATFSALATTSPLARGPVAEPLPPAYLRASLPLTAIRGDVSLLPIVNRVPIEGIALGGDNALCGFQSIDSENDCGRPHLIARWKDRAVFSFPVVATLVKLGLPAAELRVVSGSHIRFGNNGPVVLIDSFGRLSAAPASAMPTSVIPAGDLLDTAVVLPSVSEDSLIVLRDDRSNASAGGRAFSARLAGDLAAFSSPSQTRIFPRLSAAIEWLLLGSLCALLAACGSLRPKLRAVVLWFLLADVFIATWFGLRYGVWLPLFPALAAVASSMLVMRFTKEIKFTPNEKIVAAETLTAPAGKTISHPEAEEELEATATKTPEPEPEPDAHATLPTSPKTKSHRGKGRGKRRKH